MKKFLLFFLITVLCFACGYGGVIALSGIVDKETIESDTGSIIVDQKNDVYYSFEIVGENEIEIPELHDSQVLFAGVESNKLYRTALNERQKVLYDDLCRYVTRLGDCSAPVNADLSGDEIVDTMLAYFHDNPGLYWLTSSFKLAYNGYGKYVAVAYVHYDCDPEFFASVTEPIIAKAKVIDDVYKRAKYLYEFICEHIEYDYEYSARGSLLYDQSTYSACQGLTVCAGYARMYRYLANASGIMDTIVVISKNHAWNQIAIEGDWYVIDATWGDKPDGTYDYNYLCIGIDTLVMRDKDDAHVISEFRSVVPAVSRDDYMPGVEESSGENMTETTAEESTETTSEMVPETSAERPTEEITTAPIESTTSEPIEETTKAPEESIPEKTEPEDGTEPISETEPVDETEPIRETEPVKETKPVFIQGYWYKDGMFRRDYDSIVEVYSLNGGFGHILFNTSEFNDPRGMLSYAITFDEKTYFEIPICRTDDSGYVGNVLISKGSEFKIVAFDAYSREVSYISSTELFDIDLFDSITYTFAYPEEAERGQYINSVVDVTGDDHATFYDPEYEYGLTICFSDGTYEEKNNAYGETVYTFSVEADDSCFIGHSLYNLEIGLRGSDDGEYKFTVSDEICPYILTVDETRYFLFVEGGRAFMLKEH